MANRSLNVKDVAYISVLAALCVLATFIKIPFGSKDESEIKGIYFSGD